MIQCYIKIILGIVLLGSIIIDGGTSAQYIIGSDRAYMNDRSNYLDVSLAQNQDNLGTTDQGDGSNMFNNNTTSIALMQKPDPMIANDDMSDVSPRGCSNYNPDQWIINKYFGLSSWYTRHRLDATCDPCKMKTVYLDSSTGLPSNYESNTLYLLSSGTYLVENRINNRLQGQSCVGIIGQGDVWLRSLDHVNIGMFNIFDFQNIILENISIDGIPYSGEITMDTQFWSSVGLDIGKGKNLVINNLIIKHTYSSSIDISKVAYAIINSSILNGGRRGASIKGNNIGIYNSLIYNQRKYGIYLYSGNNIVVQNSQIFNNREAGFANDYGGTNVLINNNVIYNNNDQEKFVCDVAGGVLFLKESGQGYNIMNTMIYNNGLRSIQIISHKGPFVSLYTGVVVYDPINDIDIKYLVPGVYHPLLGEGKNLEQYTGLMSCDYVTQIGDYFASYPSCDFKGDKSDWLMDDKPNIIYGTQLPKQVQPMIYDDLGQLVMSTIPYDHEKAIGQD